MIATEFTVRGRAFNHFPGITPHRQKHRARFPLDSQWVYLGLEETEAAAYRLRVMALDLDIEVQRRIAAVRGGKRRRELLERLVKAS